MRVPTFVDNYQHFRDRTTAAKWPLLTLLVCVPRRQIVNKQESDAVERLGVPFVAVNIAVGLSLSMPSVAASIAEALVTGQPFGNMTLVGAR